jgi:serine palmitoyltransferase
MKSCSKVGKYVTIDGKECLNLATMNFLGMIGKEEIEVMIF